MHTSPQDWKIIVGIENPCIERRCVVLTLHGLQDVTTLQPVQGCGVPMWLYRGDAPLAPAYGLLPLWGKQVCIMMATYSF